VREPWGDMVTLKIEFYKCGIKSDARVTSSETLDFICLFKFIKMQNKEFQEFKGETPFFEAAPVAGRWQRIGGLLST
jgi:hypothetical protein